MSSEPNEGGNDLPVRLRRGHKQECPGCNYTGKNLIGHLRENHPDAFERYERASRGVWVLEESEGGTSETEGVSRGGGGDGAEDEPEGQDERSEKERRIVELEARIEEMEERIEDLKETREGLKQVAEEALTHLPAANPDSEGVALSSDAGKGGENGTTDAGTGEKSTEGDGDSVADPIDERHEKLVIERKDGPRS